MTQRTCIAAADMLLTLAILGVSITAHADDVPTPMGISLVTGGGVTAFRNSDMQHAAGPGLIWEARAAIGTRLPLGLEVTCSGFDRGVSIPGTRNGSLDGSTLDAAVRLTLLPRHKWSLYGFGGVGWQRYMIVGAVETRSVMHSTDNTGLTVPVGAGVVVRIAPAVIIDVRGTYRISETTGVLPETGGGFAAMNAWEATAAFGLEL